MKTEDLNQECPECGCKDKSVSQTKKKAEHKNKSYNTVPHFDVGVVGVYAASKCGHILNTAKTGN